MILHKVILFTACTRNLPFYFSVKPRFLCNSPQMAYTYKRDVEFRCSVRADPELKEISWLWYEKDGKTNRTLKPYEWRSLYHTSLEKGVS